jgi:hypothetical protein
MPKKEKANLFRIEFPAEKNKKTSRVEREMGGVNSYLSREKKKRCMAIRVGTIRFQSTGIFLLLLTLIAAAAAAAALATRCV